MLVEKRHGNTSRIILIILTPVQLWIAVSIAMKKSSTQPACMINDLDNRSSSNLIVLLFQLDQELVGIAVIFTTV